MPFLKPGPRLKQCEEKISETCVRPQGRACQVEPLGGAGEQQEEDGKGHLVDGVHFAFTRLSLVKAESSKWSVTKCSPFQLQSNHCTLWLDFRPFYHQVLEDYLKLKLPCFCSFWSSLKMYDQWSQTKLRKGESRYWMHNQFFNQPKARSRNTSAGSLFKLCCQASIKYRVAVSD